MPYATNAIDGRRIWFEDDGGPGDPVVCHGGIVDSVDLVRESPLVSTLARFPEEFRLVPVDHRGVGRSDAPHDPAAYAMRLRVADATAVLDEIGARRAHFVGTSWGGRLGFGIGEHAPKRVSSLVIGGQQPYAVRPDGALARVVVTSLRASREAGTLEPFVAALEALSGIAVARDTRERYLANDPVAIEAASSVLLSEGDICSDLGSWRFPCLVWVGANDADFRDQARRAAAEIPGAEFVEIGGAGHLEAHLGHDEVIEAALRTLRRAAPDR